MTATIGTRTTAVQVTNTMALFGNAPTPAPKPPLEPSQTEVLGAASWLEPLKSHSLERNGGGGARKRWLRSAPRFSPRPFPALPPGADCSAGARPSEGGQSDLVAGGRGAVGPRRSEREAAAAGPRGTANGRSTTAGAALRRGRREADGGGSGPGAVGRRQETSGSRRGGRMREKGERIRGEK